MRPFALMLVATFGCAPALASGPPDPLREVGRAALAVVVVENRAAHPIRISFVMPALGQGEIMIGSVAAGAVHSLPPIPAGEPIILIARDPDGAQLRLGPRSFPVDQSWHWVIAADAQFVPMGGD